MDPFDAALCDDKVQEIHDGAWQEGYEEGATSGEKKGFEAGMKEGITKVEKVFIGHVSIGECFAGHAVRQDAAMNTENISASCSAAVQMSAIEDADSITDYQPAADEPSFNWADNASSIPIHYPPHSHLRRNLSALRTESISKPFSSLQRDAYTQWKRRKHESITPDTSQPTSQQCATQSNRHSRPHSKG